MKVGLIGVGGRGMTHNRVLKELSQNKDITVTAIADAVPEHLEAASALWPGVHTYTDGMELLEKEELDSVHICLPSHMHANVAVEAMNRGIHVLIEKPVALTDEDCAQILEARNRNHVLAMVGQVVRFYPQYQVLKEAYESGRYGALKSLVMQRMCKNIMRGYENWFYDENRSGSVVLDLHIHDLDFARYLLGEPEEFRVQATAYENGMVNQIMTTYEYPGMFVSAEAIWDVTPDLPFQAYYRAYFDDATITFANRETPSVRIWKKDGSEEIPELGEVSATYLQLAYFYDCLEQGAEPAKASLEEGIASVQLAKRELAAAHEYLSGKKGETKDE